MSDAEERPGSGQDGFERTDRYGVPAHTDWKKISKFTLLGVLVAAAVTFVFSNQDPVEVSFLTISMNTTLFWALLLALVLGGLIGVGGTLWWQRRRRRIGARRAE